MAFTEADRVQIRKYLGFADLYQQIDSRLESAINAVQSVADGGTRPTSDAENEVKGIIVELKDIDARVKALRDQQAATELVGEVRLDAARETHRLWSEGRVYVERLARIFDTKKRADAFGFGSGFATSQDAHRSSY